MRIWQRIRNNMKNFFDFNEREKKIQDCVFPKRSRIILKNKVESARECVILQDMFKKI